MDSLHTNTVIVGLFAILVFLHYHLLRKSRAAKNKPPPQVAGGWPIIGHLHLLGGPQLPHITLGALADKYGPIFTMRFGVHQSLVVSSWELAKEIFTTHDLVTADRPKLIAAKHFGYNNASFGFAPHGPYWREIRKIITVELLSNRRLEQLKHVRAFETKSATKELYKLWCEKKNGSGHVLVEMRKWFGDLGFNVILRMVFGKRYFGAAATGDEKEARRAQKVVREFFRLMGVFVLGDAVPYLEWLDWGGHEKEMKIAARELDSLISAWLEEHKRNRASGEAKGDQDFMDAMLSILDGESLAGYDSDTVNKATCLNLLLGGGDTIKVTLTWALCLLLDNPHTLKKAQEELDLHVGKERMVEETDIGKLVYLQAIFKETLRLYTPGPLGGPRVFTEDCTIGGYNIPKGTRLLFNVHKIQRDPRVWSDPSKFQPERFLTTHKDVDMKGAHFELIPFVSGRRSCPGSTFAVQMLHLVMANFLHSFDVSKLSNAPIDMTEIPGLTNIKASPLDVFVTPRLPSNLYEY